MDVFGHFAGLFVPTLLSLVEFRERALNVGASTGLRYLVRDSFIAGTGISRLLSKYSPPRGTELRSLVRETRNREREF
jgi:hypothetical protein